MTLAIPALYILVFGVFLFRKGDSDWDQMLAFHQIELWNTKLFGLEKQWNPLMSGGMSLAGDPQVPVLSLSMMLARVLPSAAGLKLAVLLFVALGWGGAFLLARRFRLDRTTSALAASLFAGNGYILSRLSHGHIGFLGTLCLPLWLWAGRVVIRQTGETTGRATRRLITLLLAGGVLFALSADGAPMAILLLAVWVGLDAALLAWRRRSAAPIVFFVGAFGLGALLDAAFVLPMVANQTIFPRGRPGVFLDPLLFFWFLILPVRGKVLPAPANGHEFSVYIGPVLAYLLIRYRSRIMKAFPADERRRCVIVSAVTFAIGLGAFRALAPWLPPGPFDLLHELPGFRAVGIPGRFWGYFALPLALAGAVAIRGLEQETSPGRPRRALWALLFLFALGFQLVALADPFLTRQGRLDLPRVSLPREIHTIVNVEGPVASQARVLKPDVGILKAYNLHDYVRGEIAPGSELVRGTTTSSGTPLLARAEWDGWSQIVVTLPEGGGPGAVLFNQNFHPLWISSEGVVTRDRRGNLALRLLAREPAGATIRLRFRDGWSILGGKVSRVCAAAVLLGALALAGVEIVLRRRSLAGAATEIPSATGDSGKAKTLRPA